MTFSVIDITLRRKTLLSFALISVLLVVMSGCGGEAGVQAAAYSEPQSVTPEVEYWQDRYPDCEFIKRDGEDLNGDNREDTVVIYRRDDTGCLMLVVMNLPEGYYLTEPVPAPVSDQQISFTDFDNRPPTEVVVSGRNGSSVGIGIFRLEEECLINLFEDDYDKCCR